MGNYFFCFLRMIYSLYTFCSGISCTSFIWTHQPMVFHEDKSLLCSHLVKSLKVVFVSQSKKINLIILWLFLQPHVSPGTASYTNEI